MNESSHDDGVILALINRFERQRLPRLLALREKTGNGGKLSDADIVFLDRVMHDARQSKRLIDRHPEWHAFCARVIHLYETIIERALENERRS